jgi:hypothetical protein
MWKAVVAERLSASPGKDTEPYGRVPDDGVSMQRETLGDLEPCLTVDDIDPARPRKGHKRKNNHEDAHGCQ